MVLEIAGWLIVYMSAGCFVFLIFRFLALDHERRSAREFFSLSDFFELSGHEPLLERVLYLSLFVALMFFWPVVVFLRIYQATQGSKGETVGVTESPYVARNDMLVRRVTLEEAEEEGLIQDPLGGLPNLTFGFFYDTWQKFLAQMQAGDELWAFSTQQAEQEMKSFHKQVSGFVLLRNGEVVGEFIAESN